MESADLKALVKQTLHSGRSLRDYAVAKLPIAKYTAEIRATMHQGVQKLDEVFFQLIQNGVVTREALAKHLGLNLDSFIFNHVDILVREGYVAESNERYQLTESGVQFLRGETKEETLKTETFTMYWDEVGEVAVADLESRAFQPLYQNSKFKLEITHQGGLVGAALGDALAKSFNHKFKTDGLEFYQLVRLKNHKKEYAVYIAIFLSPPNATPEDWELEIRQFEKHNKDWELVLNRELTAVVNDRDGPWREQFAKWLVSKSVN